MYYHSDLNLLVSPSLNLSTRKILGVSIGIALVDASRTILQVNRAFCDFLGCSSVELVGETIDRFTHPEDRSRTLQTFRILQSDDEPVHAYEKRYLRKDGTVVWSLTTVNRLASSSSKDAPLFIGFIQDINTQKEAEGHLRSTKNLYQALVENVGVGLALIDREHRVLMANPALGRMFKRNVNDFIGKHCFQEFEKRSTVCAHCTALMAMDSGQPQTLITEGVHDDGSRFKVRIKTFPVFDGSGVANAFVEMIEDLSAQLQMEQALSESEERFRSIFEKSGVGMMLVSRAGRIIEANPAFCSLVGYAANELTGGNVSDLTHPEDLGRLPQNDRLACNDRNVSYQKRYLHKAGTTVWGEVTGAWVPGGSNGQEFGIRVVQDITKKKEAQARLEYLDNHDELTGLPNQKLLKDRLTHAIAKALRNNTQIGIMFISLDRFTKIISTFDHRTGNLVLKQIADRLRETVRQADTLARFGDTEFVILLEDVGKLKTTRVVAQHILQKIAEPIMLLQNAFHVTASLGISLFPDDGEDAEYLLRSASAAMNRAKQQGGDLFEYFIPELNARTRELINLEADLRKALKNEEFVLHFQPQVELLSRTIVGFEALARWQHPERGLVPPTCFIPVAEETGVIVPIGEWILREACRQNMEWLRAGLPPTRMAVNISPRQFRRVDLPDLLRRVLAETGHPPELLELEVTESMVMEDVGRAIETMKEIAGMGIHLAIDDFGTGYSSLHYLKRFPVQRLKVDRSFVQDVMTDHNDAAIASAVVALAKAMNLEVVAEGIETEEQLAFFLDRGCEFCQGFLFSKPLDPAAATEFLAGRHSARR